MEPITRHRQALRAEIETFLTGKKQQTAANPWQNDLIDRLLPLAASGKLLRGSLVCFMHDAFGGTSPETATRTAAALELIHTALLVHDDIMDRDDTRRGRPALHVQYRRPDDPTGQFGENMALCTADAAIFMTYEILSRLDNLPPALLRLFGETFATVCAGQMLDIELSSTGRPATKKQIQTVMQQKTAAYSVALPLAAGAILANQPDAVLAQLNRIGHAIGTIFQIRDDELGIFGDTAALGKPVGSDIREGKKTLIHYYAVKLASPPDRTRLVDLFGNPNLTQKDISTVRHIIEQSGARSALDQQVSRLKISADTSIRRLPIAQKHQATLISLATFCATRNK